MSVNQNVDSEEIRKFESLAHQWWDRDSKFRPLHDINDLRLKFIDERSPVHDKRVLEVGCGGGILTESLFGLGAETTGIDPALGPLTVAKLHARENGIANKIRYLQKTGEEFALEEPNSFDVVAALEMLEHVPDFRLTVQALADLTRPGGDMFLSTINRHPLAYALMVVAGEYVLNVLPKGTHDYTKFIKPSELCSALRKAGMVVSDLVGYRYNPFTRVTTYTASVDVNYLIHARKPA